MNETNDYGSEHVWERGWEDHRIQQMRRMAKLPFALKLQWLEEAQRLAKQLQKTRATLNYAQTTPAQSKPPASPPPSEP
jgi:hypothetical protein